jgi:hypothetical protein
MGSRAEGPPQASPGRQPWGNQDQAPSVFSDGCAGRWGGGKVCAGPSALGGEVVFITPSPCGSGWPVSALRAWGSVDQGPKAIGRPVADGFKGRRPATGQPRATALGKSGPGTLDVFRRLCGEMGRREGLCRAFSPRGGEVVFIAPSPCGLGWPVPALRAWRSVDQGPKAIGRPVAEGFKGRRPATGQPRATALGKSGPGTLGVFRRLCGEMGGRQDLCRAFSPWGGGRVHTPQPLRAGLACAGPPGLEKRRPRAEGHRLARGRWVQGPKARHRPAQGDSPGEIRTRHLDVFRRLCGGWGGGKVCAGPSALGGEVVFIPPSPCGLGWPVPALRAWGSVDQGPKAIGRPVAEGFKGRRPATGQPRATALGKSGPGTLIEG